MNKKDSMICDAKKTKPTEDAILAQGNQCSGLSLLLFISWMVLLLGRCVLGLCVASLALPCSFSVAAVVNIFASTPAKEMLRSSAREATQRPNTRRPNDKSVQEINELKPETGFPVILV